MKTAGYALLFTAGLAGLYFGYKYITKFHSKDKALAYLVTIGKGSQAEMSTWDEGFVIAFANAAKSANNDFEFNGKKYSTKTGRAL